MKITTIPERLLIFFTVVGGLFVLIGLFRGITESRRVQVEIINSDAEIKTTDAEIYVIDVAGAVEKPGVVSVAKGSRIKDVLVLVGGLSAEADRERISRSMNLAIEVKDGQKIYFPKVGEEVAGVGYSEINNSTLVVNINTASVVELDTLDGIGETRAKAIIDGRPYNSVDELLSKGVLPKSVFEKIKSSISI